MKGGNFQLIVVIIFIAAAIFGVLVFSGTIPIGKDKNETGAQGTVVLWGTVKGGVMAPLMEEFNRLNPSFVVNYVARNADTFDQDLLEALASGTGPDLFLLPQDLAFHYSNKIFVVPYSSYPLAGFKSNFAAAGEVFLASNGIIAFPLVADPLVMYYNRSMLDAAGITNPPQYWDEFVQLMPLLTKKNEENRIIKSAAGLGQFSNVANAKGILSALFMQSGDFIISETEGEFVSVLGKNAASNTASSLDFYTGFADPSKTAYTWNKSLPNSTDAFTAQNVAFYFGRSSELSSILARNPNLNFGVASIPQLRSTDFKLTSANVFGIAVSAFSKNMNTAFVAASTMATGDFAGKFSAAVLLPPVRRDLLSGTPSDAYFPIFYRSALFSRAWLDPAPADTSGIFQKMVDNVLSGNLTSREAVEDASSKLDLLLAR